MIHFREFRLRPGEIHCFGESTAVYLISGDGSFQIDFKDYRFSGGNILFFNDGQYLKMIEGDLQMQLLALPENVVGTTVNSQFLFRHVVGVGFIKLDDPNEFFSGLETPNDFLAWSVNAWVTQNPFQAELDEVKMLFRLKEMIDKAFNQPLTVDEVLDQVGFGARRANDLARRKLGLTPKRMIDEKRLLEAQKKVIFTDYTTKEIAYAVGFDDPKYFGRYFRKNTRMTPHSFRERFEVPKRDSFETRLMQLIENNYKQNRNASFYADKLGLTTNALLRKIKRETGTTLVRLIRNRLLHEAKALLRMGNSVSAVADALGFDEPSYFSFYFSNGVGASPSEFLLRS